MFGFRGPHKVRQNGRPHCRSLAPRANHLIGIGLGKRKGPVATKRSFVFLSEDELLSVLRLARATSIRNWCMILMTYSHGLRASETCELKMSDINMRDGIIEIQRKKGSLHTIQELMPHRGKPELDEIKALKSWLANRPRDCGDALFTSQKGSHLTATQFYRIFRVIAQRAGLPKHKSHPHVLKHSVATHMVRQDVN